MQMVLRLSSTSISTDNYKVFTEDEFETYFRQKSKELGFEEIGSVSFVSSGFGDRVACCIGVMIGSVWVFEGFAFSQLLLNGKDFTLSEIDDMIIHELCHAIVNQKYNENCGHDKRWEKMCIEKGCLPSVYQPLALYDTKFSLDIIDDCINTYPFVLRCNKCSKLYNQSENFDFEVFKLFFFYESKLPISLGKLNLSTSCCNSPYRYEFESKKLLVELKKLDILSELQDRIVEYEEKHN